MTGKNGMIVLDELTSLCSRYRIPNNVELSAPKEGEILRDHRFTQLLENHLISIVVLQVRKFRADRRFWALLLSRKMILGCVTFVGKRNMKIILNLPDLVPNGSSSSFMPTLRRRMESSWNDEQPEVKSVTLEEREWGQWAVWEFFQSHNLKWHSTKGAFFRWFHGLPLSGVLVASPRGGLRGHLGCRQLAPLRLDHRTWAEEYPKKKKRLIKGTHHILLDIVRQGSPALDEEERLARQEDTDLQAGLMLSREEIHLLDLIIASPKASLDPTPLVPAPSSAPMADVEGPLSCCGADLGEAETSMRRGVLGSTFGQTFSCPSDDQLFCQPFDTEARALKILSDLLPLLELEERIRLIDGCASQAEYLYHVLGSVFAHLWGRPHVRDPLRTSRIIDEEERQKIIVVGKRSEETGVAQVFQKVLRPNASVPSQCEFLEEAFVKAHSTRGRTGAMLGQRYDRGRAKDLREQAEGAVSEFRSVLNVTRAELDEAHDDAEGVPLAKQDLERTLVEATTEASDLCLSEVEALSAYRADPNINGETSRVELETMTGQVLVLQEWVAVLSSREAKLLAESEAARAKVELTKVTMSGWLVRPREWGFLSLFEGRRQGERVDMTAAKERST
ncbi:hypothetical protein ACLOJK_017903 [Asimina triloba]